MSLYLVKAESADGRSGDMVAINADTAEEAAEKYRKQVGRNHLPVVQVAPIPEDLLEATRG